MKARVVEQEIDEYDLKNLNFAAFAKEHKPPRGNFFMYNMHPLKCQQTLSSILELPTFGMQERQAAVQCAFFSLFSIT
jgi:hypothetical protein